MIPLLLALTLQAAVQPPAAEARSKQPTLIESEAPFKVQAKGREPLICKSEEVLGSRIPTTVCHTREEWVQMQAATDDFLYKQQHSMTCAKAGAC